MKHSYYLYFLLLVPPVWWCIPHTESVYVEEPITEVVEEPYIPTDWELFTEAVIWKESRGNTSAVGDGGRAVGPLQMWPIMVREANRVQSDYVFTLDDRLSREKSIAMWNAIQSYHNPTQDFKKALQIWNKNHPKSYETQILSKYEELYNSVHKNI